MQVLRQVVYRFQRAWREASLESIEQCFLEPDFQRDKQIEVIRAYLPE